MTNSVKPVTFKNQNGRNLFGILHLPDQEISRYGIIILTPGIKSRVAPHRLYVKMAERFITMGFPVLRVDPEGLGDSEGEIHENWTADVYCSIQLGRLVVDTIQVMDWMEKEVGTSRFILSGLCGGAITALLTADRDKRVDSIISMGMTCILDSPNIDPLKYITTSQLNSIREKYIKKLFNIRAWGRFLCFKSDYRLLSKAIFQPFKKKEAGTQRSANQESSSLSLEQMPPNSNLNPHFPKAFINFVSEKEILLIFSEADRLYWEFEEKFLSYYSKLLKAYQENFEIYTIKNANHVFTFKEWQEKMLDKSEAWMKRKYVSKN